MKQLTKFIISIIVGIIFICIGMNMSNFSLNDSFKQLDFRQDIKPIEDIESVYDSIDELDIDVKHCIIDIKENMNKDDQKFYLKATDLYEGHLFLYDNNTLTIKQEDQLLKRYVDGIPHVELIIPKGYRFKEVDLYASLGQVECSYVPSELLSIENRMSNICLKNVNTNGMNLNSFMSNTCIYTENRYDKDSDIECRFSKIKLGNDSYVGYNFKEGFEDQPWSIEGLLSNITVE